MITINKFKIFLSVILIISILIFGIGIDLNTGITNINIAYAALRWSDVQSINSSFRLGSIYARYDLSASLGLVTRYIGTVIPKVKMTITGVESFGYAGMAEGGYSTPKTNYDGQILQPGSVYHLYVTTTQTKDSGVWGSGWTLNIGTSGGPTEIDNAYFKYSTSIMGQHDTQFKLNYKILNNAAPTINVSKPVPTTYTNIIPINGSVNDTDAGDVNNIYYSIDSGSAVLLGTLTSNGSTMQFPSKEIDIKGLSNGSHTLKVWTVDTFGEESSPIQSIVFTKAAALPTLNISNTIVKGGTTINITTNVLGDIYIVKSGTYTNRTQLDNAVNTGNGTKTPITFSTGLQVISPLNSGYYKVYAVDSLSNLSPARTILVDNTQTQLISSFVSNGKIILQYDKQLKNQIPNTDEIYVEKKQQTGIVTLIAGEENLIVTDELYDDFEYDPYYTRYYQFNHDETYLDNPNGKASFHGQILSSPVSTFSQVGMYDLLNWVKDNPKNSTNFSNYRLDSNKATKQILVHRRPISLFSTQINLAGSTLNITYFNQSYDLDHANSRSDKGIIQEVWQYKNINSDNWTNNKPASLAYNSGIYEIKLTVKDIEGAWSNPYTVLLNTSQIPPTVDCTPTIKDWTNVNITATVSATDTSGDYSYTNYAWTTSITKPTSGWIKNTAATFTTTLTSEGIYYLHMEAFDAAGNKFYRYRGPYKLDKTPPVINSVTTDGTIINANSYKVYANNVTDTLSGVKEVRFPTWTTYNGQDDLIQPWVNYYLGTNYSGINWSYVVNSSGEDGIYNTHVYAWDYAGNYTFVAAPNVSVQKNQPPTVSITGITPTFIYEGDTVKVRYKPNDNDMQNLTSTMQLTKNGTVIWSKTKTITPLGGSYATEEETVLTGAEAGASYKFTVTVTDPYSSTAAASTTFTAYALGITGQVSHTTLWEQHRQDYNKSKSGNINSPRLITDFFPGEKFILSANTTNINSGSTVYAANVTCSIIGTSFASPLSPIATPYNWTGSIWDETMLRWDTQPVRFRFTVTYSNGTVKTSDVIINILDDEYWRLHRLF